MSLKFILTESQYNEIVKKIILERYIFDTDVEKIQSELKDKYNLGSYGPNKDGVDGLLGPLTKKAMTKEMEKNPTKKDEYEKLIKKHSEESDVEYDRESEKVIKDIDKSEKKDKSSFGGEPGTSEVILVGGLDTRRGDYNINDQVKLLKKDMIGIKNVIGHRYSDISGALDSIKNNPNAKVVLFSAGCKHADKISKVIGDKKNLFIVEPYAVSPATTDSIRRAISSGVPESNVVVGPSRGRGKGVVDSSTNTPSGVGHWGALNWVGSKI